MHTQQSNNYYAEKNTLRYFTEFGKPAFQHITAPEFIQEYIGLFCSACTMSS